MMSRLFAYFLLLLSVSFIFLTSKQAFAVVDIDKELTGGISCGHPGGACCSVEESRFEDVDIPIGDIPVLGFFLDPPGPIPGIKDILDFNVSVVGKGMDFLTGHLMDNIFRTTRQKCLSGKAQGSGDSCVCVDDRVENLTRLCQGIKSPGEIQQCVVCTGGSGRNPGRGIWTGLGCFETDISALIKNTLLGLGVGLGGVVSMLCIIYSSVMLQTSGGNPERIKKAREYLTSCIAGLLLILFSVFLLQLIGVNILRLPGFS